MESEIKNTDVCLKFYNELMNTNRWEEAITLLDKAQEIENQKRMAFPIGSTNWLEIKQQLLNEHGTKEDRIENLKKMFYNSLSDKDKYYHQLKDLVNADEWRSFYHELLSRKDNFNNINYIAQFLIEEGDFNWLFALILEAVTTDVCDYRTPLKYAKALRHSHYDEMQAVLTRSICAYAADRFRRKKEVKTSKYTYFCEDINALAAAGYNVTQANIVKFLLKTYYFRPALIKNLRTIKLS